MKKSCSTCNYINLPFESRHCEGCYNGFTFTNWAKRHYSEASGLNNIQPEAPRSGHPMFYELLDRLAEIHSKKNQDYGNGNPLGNFMGVLPLGVDPFMGVLVRLSDKWSRICTLAQKGGQGQVKDESITDTLMDMAAYALLAIVIRAETQKK